MYWREFTLKKYVTPEYENKNQLVDIILTSVVADEKGHTITGIIDIEDLFKW